MSSILGYSTATIARRAAARGMQPLVYIEYLEGKKERKRLLKGDKKKMSPLEYNAWCQKQEERKKENEAKNAERRLEKKAPLHRKKAKKS